MAEGRLREVEEDAQRITQKRFDDFFAEAEYQKEKARLKDLTFAERMAEAKKAKKEKGDN